MDKNEEFLLLEYNLNARYVLRFIISASFGNRFFITRPGARIYTLILHIKLQQFLLLFYFHFQ